MKKKSNINILYLTSILTTVFLILPLSLGYTLQSSEPALVTGNIIDKDTQLPLANVNIIVINSNTGATSDSLGTYKLQLAEGDYAILISHIGYTELKQKIVIQPGVKKLIIDFELEPFAIPLPEITVTEEKGEDAISRYTIKEKPLRNMASPLPDVLLILKTLPGVASLNDQSTLYNVRGGNFDENLIYINGVEIYQPQLVRKGIMENPSLVNPNLLEVINFQTGVFPVSYGDKLSSVLDLQYRQKFDRKYFAKADVSAIGANATIGLRLLNNSWLQIATRKISYGYIFKSLETKGDYTPVFRDLQGLFHLSPSDKLELTFFGLKASSKFNASSEKSTNISFFNGIFDFQFGGSEVFTYQTGLLSMVLNYKPGNAFSLKWMNSYFGQKEEENTFLSTRLIHRSLESSEEAEAFRHEIIKNYLDARFYKSYASFEWIISPSMLINAGVEMKYFSTQDSLSSSYREESELDGIDITTSEKHVKKLSTRHGSILGRFIQTNIKASNKLALQFGLRWIKSSLNHEQLFLPRVQFLYRLSKISKLVFAVGRYAQPPIYKEFQFREEDDSGLLAQKATQFTLGLERILKNDLSFKLEVYYKRYSDLISYDLKDVQIKYSGVNDAVGYAYGLEVFLRGSFIPDTENWISYSYLVAREDLLHDQVGYVPRASDRRHQFAFYGEDRMERFPWSKLFVRFIFGTGYPYTSNSWVLNNDKTKYQLKQNKRNSSRLPLYYRFDFGFSQEIRLGENIHIFLREEILNLHDKKNILGYDLAFNKLVVHHLSGRIFNFGLRLEL